MLTPVHGYCPPVHSEGCSCAREVRKMTPVHTWVRIEKTTVSCAVGCIHAQPSGDSSEESWYFYNVKHVCGFCWFSNSFVHENRTFHGQTPVYITFVHENPMFYGQTVICWGFLLILRLNQCLDAVFRHFHKHYRQNQNLKKDFQNNFAQKM